MSVDACPAGSPPTDTALVGARFCATSGLSLKRQGKGLRGARGNAEAPHSEAYITNQYLVRSQITYTVPLLFFGHPLGFPFGFQSGFSLGMLLGFRSGPIRAWLGFPSSGRMLALSQPLWEGE